MRRWARLRADRPGNSKAMSSKPPDKPGKMSVTQGKRQRTAQRVIIDCVPPAPWGNALTQCRRLVRPPTCVSVAPPFLQVDLDVNDADAQAGSGLVERPSIRRGTLRRQSQRVAGSVQGQPFSRPRRIPLAGWRGPDWCYLLHGIVQWFVHRGLPASGKALSEPLDLHPGMTDIPVPAVRVTVKKLVLNG
ncbi:hypothetical protein OKW49_002901 [Paraburkholderia youngii]